MSMMAAVRVFELVFVLLMLGGRTDSVHDGPLLLLVSFDGFRYDYLDRSQDRVQLPNFKYLVQTGVRAKWVHNSFITKTFPNHFTIATGMYEESHGIVANSMYDPELGEMFHVNTSDPRWWDVGGEPIWITNQKHLGGKSGVLNWPGMQAQFNNTLPFRHLPAYNMSIPYKERVDTMVGWFKDSEDPINLGVLYFEEPDHTGHFAGPESKEIDETLDMVDRTVGYLIDELKAAGLFERMNVIITSDHGMMEVSQERVIELDRYLDPSTYLWVDRTPVAAIWPHDEVTREHIYTALHNAHPKMHVYYKEDIPAQYHYRHNRRIMPVIAVADPGWTIAQNASLSREWNLYKGNHGYNNSYLPMNPIFVAHGPAFRSNLLSEPFNNVDIYPLMCHILGLDPHPNNGSYQKVAHLVKKPTSWGPPPSTPEIIGVAIGLILVLGMCIVGCGIYMQRLERSESIKQAHYTNLGKAHSEEDGDTADKEPLLEAEGDV
ncbi:bis(5'-adenosyl)-triphosphatase ENPP4-like [Branchiostoma floridae]|uniref:Bis(5'-adenosyl)-triphosphatase ENPP4-like n=1 Tax=Branchiostoma floridae TaxID=7739 RepID=A0A9J7LQG8_BRAFL|nr:bis(5'-adenosyl)-triphosphatase ENPP4-like [Branchiostoma floridae]